MNKTPNYQLNQWEAADKVQRTDFNADNAKIDAAIKAEADARTALAGQVAKCGNCRIWSTSYVGNGIAGYGRPTTFTFPQKPLLAMICAYGSPQVAWLLPVNGAMGYDYSCYVTWSGNTASWYADLGEEHPEYQLNYKGGNYLVVAFMAAD